MKGVSINHQTPNTKEPPNPKHQTSAAGRRLRFEVWSLFGVWCLVFGVFASARADTILNSKHDLSVGGPGPVKAVAETEVCSFCHTPHRGIGERPLWSHALSGATYIPYASSTTKAAIGQPTGASKLCLSCHDGTVALGMVNNRVTPIEMQSGVTTLPPGRSQLGTDLSDDHPISFTFDSALASANGKLNDPSTLTGDARLDHNNQLQCTSCHDSHNNQYGKFLVQNNYASALCLQCHKNDFWQASSHSTSTKTWNNSGLNPWPHTELTTVAANACENCHAPHGAGTKPRLLNFANEEQNCYSCHSGTVAAKNVAAEFNKLSVHPVANTSGVHDPLEDPINSPRHVECADCHNAHAAKKAAASAPNAPGSLTGLTGISSAGAAVNPLTKEYELCFRCHADSLNRGPARVPRQVVETNTRLDFDIINPSYHPVVAVGKNANVPSLLAPWTTSSLMYCTDCHDNEQGPNASGSGPNGPHGSAYVPLLERNLTTVDLQIESYTSYALCYKCHDRNSLLADQSFVANVAPGVDRGHRFHIVDEKTACTTCHDSHGVATNPRLINFNTSYVTPYNGTNVFLTGKIEFNSTGTYSGNCTLICHGWAHSESRYGPNLIPSTSPVPLRRKR